MASLVRFTGFPIDLQGLRDASTEPAAHRRTQSNPSLECVGGRRTQSPQATEYDGWADVLSRLRRLSTSEGLTQLSLSGQ